LELIVLAVLGVLVVKALVLESEVKAVAMLR